MKPGGEGGRAHEREARDGEAAGSPRLKLQVFGASGFFSSFRRFRDISLSEVPRILH